MDIYIADIECDTHIQGEFIIFKIYFGAGNNGKIDQNIYRNVYAKTDGVVAIMVVLV